MCLRILAARVFLGAYLVFARQVSTTELLAGIPAALAAAGYTVLLHRVAEQPFRLHAPWPRVLGGPLTALFPDAVRVGRTLLRVL